MKKLVVLMLAAALSGCGTFQNMIDGISSGIDNLSTGLSEESTSGNPSFVRQSVDYTIRDSVDRTGNLYISYQSQLPSVMTFINNDGSVTVCSSDEADNVTYIYEFADDLALKRTLNFNNEAGRLGAFTKDGDGNYYFFYAAETANQNAENMVMVKYDNAGGKKLIFKLKANPPKSFSGVKIPFDASTCRLAISGDMLAVYFGREMFNGHQASYGFVLHKDTFERIDIGAVTNPDNGKNLEMPYVSHSFNQFILPVEGGFIFADHGDAHPRSFAFSKFQTDGGLKRLQAFKFPGKTGENATYAEMGGLAKTANGYILTGAYGKDINAARNIIIVTFDDNLAKCTAPAYITSYTKEDGHAGHPKIIALDAGRYLVLWEKFRFSTQPANEVGQAPTGYQTTYMVTIDEKGKALSEMQELKGARLNMNDVLRYNSQNGKAYWAINNNRKSITVYALDIEPSPKIN
jgi:hypothetical protein